MLLGAARITPAGAAVSNDNFANAQAISGPAGSVSGSNVGATKEPGEPNHAGALGGASIWYAWTAPSSGPVAFDTCGSSFDTVIGIYTGSTVNALATVASDDDTCGSQSRAPFNATAGTLYRIAIDGFNAASTGSTVLNWAIGGPPANDNFVNAQPIAGSEGTASGTTVGASREVAEPNHAGGTGNASIWYAWTAPVAGPVTFESCGSSFDTVLAVYTGNALASLAEVAANDDSCGAQSSVTFAASSGTTYRVAVDGFLSGATGAVALRWFSAQQAPVITSASNATFRVRSAGSFTVTASGAPAPTFSLSGALPSGVTFNSTTGVLSGTPAAGTVGTYQLTITAGNGVAPDATQNFTLVVQPARAAVADFDGDGRTDPSVFRPGTGEWLIRNSSGGERSFVYGAPGDIPVAGDYDGDGRADAAVFRPSSGTWFLNRSTGGATAIAWGTSGDIPVPADYNGDGTADIAVFRPSQGAWYIRGQAGAFWGTVGDSPVPADYNGDGSADLAVYRPSQGAWYIRGAEGALWGVSDDIPVPGDYNGDGTADIAVYRPSQGAWYIRGQGGVQWGMSGDIAVPGDYNGDGRTDVAAFRPSVGAWYILGQPGVYWGASGDVPIP